MKITTIEKFVLGAIVVLVISISVSVPKMIDEVVKTYDQEQSVKNDAAFGGWVKQTGNPNGLTKEEWLALESH